MKRNLAAAAVAIIAAAAIITHPAPASHRDAWRIYPPTRYPSRHCPPPAPGTCRIEY